MQSQSFADLGLSNAVTNTLTKRGISKPFPIQQLVVGDVLAGHDLLVQSPTGSGKTIAFAAPIADLIEAEDRRPAVLVLAPTRELAVQIVEETRALCHARALRIAAVYGGVSIEKQIRAARNAHVIVATPGRLEDLLSRRAFSLQHLRVLVLDEADRMLDMGFKPAVDRIVAKCPSERQTLFFSATLSGEVGRVAKAYTCEAIRHVHAPKPDPKIQVKHRFIAVENANRGAALVKELRADRDLALVFVRTKRGADRLVKRLGNEGVKALAMHGDKSQRQRERALARFQAADVDTLVATDVAARGIDVAGISHVINFDPPEDRDSYVHRIGRTGRAGRSGVGITFVGSESARDVKRIAVALRLEHEFKQVGAALNGSSTHRSSANYSTNKRRNNKQRRRYTASKRSSSR